MFAINFLKFNFLLHIVKKLRFYTKIFRNQLRRMNGLGAFDYKLLQQQVPR